MKSEETSGNFYDRIKPRLHQRTGRELRFAHRVLDLGCGDCELVKYLSETNGRKVIGIDISSESFPGKRKANKNRPLVRCIRKDAARLDFIKNRTIDAIVMFWSLHEMSNPKAVLREARRILKPAGKILIIEFPRGSLAQKLWDENYYSKQELVDNLHKAGFKDVRAKLLESKQILWVKGANKSKKIRDNIYAARKNAHIREHNISKS